MQRLVLDEADRLLEMGFLKQIDEIITACSHPNVVRCLFSATIPADVEQLAETFLNDPIRVIIGLRNAAADTVAQRLEFCGNDSGKLLALSSLFKKGVNPPVLIFVESANRAKQLYEQLMLEGISVDYIHARRSDQQNYEVVRNFRLGKVWVLICTDVMARGLDFKGVRLVINYDFPSNVVSYIHRIGRTGRAGTQGEAVTYFTYKDMRNLKEVAEVVRRSGFEVPDWMIKARPMTGLELKRKGGRFKKGQRSAGGKRRNETKRAKDQKEKGGGGGIKKQRRMIARRDSRQSSTKDSRKGRGRAK